MHVYDSRDILCKNPFGAVEQGTEIFFSFRPPRDWGVARVFLCVWDEASDVYRELLMIRRDSLCGHDVYGACLDTGDFLGLVWYHFRCERDAGAGEYFGRAGDTGLGARQTDRPVNFQLTVYDRRENTLPTPAWFGRGVTYHIFPDRFRRLKLPETKGLVGNRTVHADWADGPDFLPDEGGIIHNRDFFGGSLAGVREKLPYIRGLGVSTIYLSPIFEAASNHRYDTADYARIDPMFGTEEEFSDFCREAAALGIRVLLDGVFNHTGHDSRYFNALGTYDEPGAYQSRDSRYYGWYQFERWPDEYASWWGVRTLPQVNESHPDYVDFIVENENSIVRRWLRAGASGWRLDVADELPGEFIGRLRVAAREADPEAVVIGEVWEDASSKIAYGVRRRYALGHELDGVMNYPLRNELIHYLLGGDAERFRDAQETLRENYPRSFYYSLMNALGTHDTPRILTVLGTDESAYALPRAVRAGKILTAPERALAEKRLRIGAAVLYCFPGSPCLYYGDEAGLEGFEDPFNRRGYPWGKEDRALIAWFARLGALRGRYEALRNGEIRYLYAEGPLLVFARDAGAERLVLCANRSKEPATLAIPWARAGVFELLCGAEIPAPAGGTLRLTMPGLSVRLLV